MFDLSQFAAIEGYLKETLGYDTVNVRSISVSRKSELTLNYTAEDDFQANIAEAHRVRHGSYQTIYADSIDEIWQQLYTIPNRAARELTVLANQLTGISGMEEMLRNVRAQQFLSPILAARDELIKYLPAPVKSTPASNIPF